MATQKERISKLERKVGNRNGIIAILILLFLGTILIIPFILGDVDENNFCLEKLNKHFPEYGFSSAYYSENYESCRGYYYEEEHLEKRDGLEERSSKKELSKTYNLISQKDIDYLESDDTKGGAFAMGIIIYFLALCVFIAMVDMR